MANLELRLFGIPKLFVDAEEVVISRPRVFECLARIIVAGPEGITRSELCQKMWPEFDTSDSRAQLRGTLLKLRAELGKLGVADQFDLTGESLLVLEEVKCDFVNFTRSRFCDLANIRRAVQPLAKPWDEENWLKESELVADALTTAFQAIKPKDWSVALDLLRKAVHSHPTSTCLSELLIRRLEALNRIDEANQVIIEFEDAWVDRFGCADLPKLSLRSPSADGTPKGTPLKAGQVKVLDFLGIGVVLVLAALFGGINLRSVPSKTRSSALKILSHKQATKFGKTFTMIQFASGDSRVNGVSRFADGAVSIQTMQERLAQEDIIEVDGRISPGLVAPVTLVDRLGNLTAIRESLRSVVFYDGLKSLRFSGSAEFSIIEGMNLLGRGKVLVRRVSDDAFHSHHETFIANTSGIQREIQPAGVRPQIVYLTFRDENDLFVSFSAGRTEGWHYHAGAYNLNTDTFTTLPFAKVAYRSSMGTLVVLPQVTDIKGGDYNTHWDGTVLLVRPNKKPVAVSISGVNQFESISCFADSLILVTDHTSASQRIQVVPIDGGAPIVNLPHQVADLLVSEDGKALVWRTYNPKRDSGQYELVDVVNGL